MTLAINYDTEIPRKLKSIYFLMYEKVYRNVDTFDIDELFRLNDMTGGSDDIEMIYFSFDLDEKTGLYKLTGNVDSLYDITIERMFELDDIKKIAQFIKFEQIIFTEDSDMSIGGDITYDKLNERVGG